MNTNYKKCMNISNQTVFSDLVVTITGCLSPQKKHNDQQNTIKIQRTIKAIIVSIVANLKWEKSKKFITLFSFSHGGSI